MLEHPQFDAIHAQYADLLQDARNSMRKLMWHQNQKALSDFVIAIPVRPLLSVMSAIVCLISLIFRAFGSSMQRFSGILMTP